MTGVPAERLRGGEPGHDLRGDLLGPTRRQRGPQVGATHRYLWALIQRLKDGARAWRTEGKVPSPAA
jgi:hypothetical protein